MSICLRRSIAVVAVALLVFSHSAVADAEDISFTGSGWGNGVGFSQYGARAMADAGDPASTILGHYYPGAVQRNLNLHLNDFLQNRYNGSQILLIVFLLSLIVQNYHLY